MYRRIPLVLAGIVLLCAVQAIHARDVVIRRGGTVIGSMRAADCRISWLSRVLGDNNLTMASARKIRPGTSISLPDVCSSAAPDAVRTATLGMLRGTDSRIVTDPKSPSPMQLPEGPVALSETNAAIKDWMSRLKQQNENKDKTIADLQGKNDSLIKENQALREAGGNVDTKVFTDQIADLQRTNESFIKEKQEWVAVQAALEQAKQAAEEQANKPPEVVATGYSEYALIIVLIAGVVLTKGGQWVRNRNRDKGYIQMPKDIEVEGPKGLAIFPVYAYELHGKDWVFKLRCPYCSDAEPLLVTQAINAHQTCKGHLETPAHASLYISVSVPPVNGQAAQQVETVQ